MRLVFLASLAMLVCASARAENPLAESPEQSALRPLDSGLILDVGLSFGGENLQKTELLGSYAGGGDNYLGAGESLFVGLGMVELGGATRLGLKQEVSYGYTDNCNNYWPPGYVEHQCLVTFGHANWEALALLGTGPADDPWKSSLGAGIVYQKGAVLTAHNSDYSTAAQVDFDNPHGWILQWQYRRVGLRFTHIVYHVPGSSVTVDGSNLALYVGFQFSGG